MTDNKTYKILLIGNASVGKTSLINCYNGQKFDNNFISTLGVESIKKKITIKNKELTLNIMDASGQERFIPLLKNYYRSADGVIFVFDLTNEKSWRYW